MNATYHYLSHKHNLYSLLILGIIYLLVNLLAPNIPLTPKGIVFTRAEHHAPPIPAEEVNVYTQLPAHSRIIGNISAETAISSRMSQQALTEKRDEMIAYARTLAGEIGAPSLIITGIGAQGQVMIFTADAASP